MRTPVLMSVFGTSIFLLSACGSSSSTTATPPAAAGGSSTPPAPVVRTSGLHAASTSLGKVLVDAKGEAVYMLTADHGGHSTCSSACLRYWPAVAPGHASPTVTAKVASTTTTGGSKIATVGGWPVYTFVQDQLPGDVTGEGIANFGGVWYAVSPSGQPVKGGSAPSTSSTPATGHGY